MATGGKIQGALYHIHSKGVQYKCTDYCKKNPYLFSNRHTIAMTMVLGYSIKTHWLV